MIPDEIITEAQDIREEEDQIWQELEGERASVVRVLVYEGPSEWLREQLGSSMSVGVRTLGSYSDAGSKTITVYQGQVRKADD